MIEISYLYEMIKKHTEVDIAWKISRYLTYQLEVERPSK